MGNAVRFFRVVSVAPEHYAIRVMLSEVANPAIEEVVVDLETHFNVKALHRPQIFTDVKTWMASVTRRVSTWKRKAGDKKIFAFQSGVSLYEIEATVFTAHFSKQRLVSFKCVLQHKGFNL
jgi:hypothetical protein